MTLEAPQLHVKTTGETRTITVSFRDVLDSGELLTGTPTVVEVTTSDLTLASKAVNTVAVPVSDVFPEEVAIGQAVQFTAAAGTAGSAYVIRVTVGTDATPAQTLSRRVNLKVVTD